jgi:hypothetical protein
VVLQQAPVAVALQDLAQCPHVHIDRAVADPIEVPLGLEAFDRLARDGRQQNSPRRSFTIAKRSSSNATVRSRFAFRLVAAP